ncbi:Protein required for attachment to host cells [Variovorax sp. OK605]|jgi:protein required for attachment to host cells|uniref:host attachment protein n=1 Tax=Variovorax sp. OK605 TaxID=1855317 RepID=UPI0008EC12C8|nr:host attachment protein [Variovorax sp. OK605]SFQ74403.1 Protein required for attachment to host cells [Variovorax sp. OK605]
MKTQWIVIANAASARIFLRDNAAASLVPVAAFSHDRSRLHASELGASNGGQAADNDPGPKRFEPRIDVRHKEHRRFAKEIAQRLDAGLNAGEYGSLTLLASNPFLGELKSQLSDAVIQRIETTLNKDLSHVGIAELERRISGSWSAVP